MVAAGDAARHLQVDQPLTTRLRLHHLAHDVSSALRDIGQAISSSPSERSSRSRWRVMSMMIAARHLADLVDAVGELVAAILDMHGGVRMR